jgi:hypothetical protein
MSHNRNLNCQGFFCFTGCRLSLILDRLSPFLGQCRLSVIPFGLILATSITRYDVASSTSLYMQDQYQGGVDHDYSKFSRQYVSKFENRTFCRQTRWLVVKDI